MTIRYTLIRSSVGDGKDLGESRGCRITLEEEKGMRTFERTLLFLLIPLLLLLVACSGYTAAGTQTSSHQTSSGGDLTVSIGKANGTTTEKIETGASSEVTLDANVTLAVGKGSYKIELLGEHEQVTLALDASEGETVDGQGWMVTDSFGEASYRVTAVEAGNVTYVIEYTFR
jgi:hypothetical protein